MRYFTGLHERDMQVLFSNSYLGLSDMQNSELFRRGIVVPLNKEAELALIKNQVDSSIEVKYYLFPDQQLFDSFWENGLFEIN